MRKRKEKKPKGHEMSISYAGAWFDSQGYPHKTKRGAVMEEVRICLKEITQESGLSIYQSVIVALITNNLDAIYGMMTRAMALEAKPEAEGGNK